MKVYVVRACYRTVILVENVFWCLSNNFLLPKNVSVDTLDDQGSNEESDCSFYRIIILYGKPEHLQKD